AWNSKFLIDGFLHNNLGAGEFEKPGVGSWANSSQMASLFARANYTFDDRYYLTATFRRDGASNLAEGNKWGNFPSVALAWRFSEEKFLEGAKNVLTNAKLRLSYGQTGNSNIGNKAKDFYQIAGTYVFGGKDNSAIGIGQMGNPALKWETTTEFNLGLDVSLYNRLDVSMEFYSREIKDLLSTRSLMSYQEVGSIAANVGKTQSKGFELTIGSKNIVKPNFSWSTDITFSLYRDRWKERDSSWKPAVYESAKDFIRSGFGYKADGLIQPGEEVKHMPGSLPGQIKIQDIDGYQKNAQGQNVIGDDGRPLRTGKPDGKLDNADKVFYGSWDPGYLFGMNNTFTYKNWDLNFYIYGAADQLMNGSYKDWNESQRIATYYGAPTTFMDSWTSQNLTSDRPGYFQTDSAHGAGDYFMKKIWYIRVRNITLGYSIPTKWSKGVLSGARVYFDVNNPFLFTNYKGIDPETDGWAGGLAAYPNVRTFSIGLDLTF
ncbi:MAG: TonB-dependent receptor, partial [Rikenellaceae bacterium]